MSYNVEAELTTRGGHIEIRNYYWSAPMDHVHRDTRPFFTFSLSNLPRGALGRILPAPRTRGFSPMGPLVFCPADAALHCINDGGSQRLLVYRLNVDESAPANGELRARLATAQANLDIRSDVVSGAFNRVASELASPGFASDTLIDSVMTGAMVDFLRIQDKDIAEADIARNGLARWQIQRIDAALAEIDGPAPSVAMLARMIGITPRHLLRKFRDSTGSTVVQYIANARYARACELLRSTELPLKQVAYKAGFAAASSFATAFRTETGLSPSEYRARYRAG